MMKYFDEKGNIRKGLLDREAEEKAKSFVRPGDRNSNLLTSAQLRRFYNEFKGLGKKVAAKGFDATLPLIKMVKSKAAYSANPKKPKIPRAFKDFLSENIDAINQKRDFEAFMLFFEAVVGFCYGQGMKNN